MKFPAWLLCAPPNAFWTISSRHVYHVFPTTIQKKHNRWKCSCGTRHCLHLFFRSRKLSALASPCVDGFSNFITWKKFRHVDFAVHSLWCCWKLGHFLEFSFRPKWLDGWLRFLKTFLQSKMEENDMVINTNYCSSISRQSFGAPIVTVSRRVYPKRGFSGCNWTNRMWAHCASGPENMHMLHLFLVRRLQPVFLKTYIMKVCCLYACCWTTIWIQIIEEVSLTFLVTL